MCYTEPSPINPVRLLTPQNRQVQVVTGTFSHFGNNVVLFSLFKVATLFGFNGSKLELSLSGQNGLLEL